ncbi:hypothetical protein [Arthrobacter sp. SLBN-83]|uniref:hypothetical protein n=1 Tax=Arthrobacter sp. SLBN-83 TaxID=2768449 RepID=UPI001359FA1A|nr:hypothetical protein [Arthrobacter sp. SLBN-83]
MDHPKIEAMSDTAKVHWLRLTGWCNRMRTDGYVSAAKAKERGPKVFKELTTELVPGRGAMLEAQPDGRYRLHDYLNHQWSKEEIELQAAKNRENGAKGGRPRTQPKPTGLEHGLRVVGET